MKLKQIPEDFVVKEIPEKEPIGYGEYIWFTVKKKGLGTLELVDILSRMLRVSPGRIEYAGLKDKNAVTEQMFSVWNVPIKRLKQIAIKNVELSNFQEHTKAIKKGQLKGNRFKIVVRDLSKKDLEGIDKKIKALRKGVLNLYDEQRFGVSGKNHKIGKAILKKDFVEAVKIYNSTNPHKKAVVVSEIPEKIRNFFVHSYQSHLWNCLAKSLGKQNTEVPITGFNIRSADKKLEDAARLLLKKEGLETDDFKGYKGGQRNLLVMPKKVRYKTVGDDLNKGKQMLTIWFELPKGSYGTQIVKSLFEKIASKLPQAKACGVLTN